LEGNCNNKNNEKLNSILGLGRGRGRGRGEGKGGGRVTV